MLIRKEIMFNHIYILFCWGHLRSRSSSFVLKIKTRGFHMKTSKVVDIFWLKKSRGSKKRVRQRGSESATARERECDSDGEISLPRRLSLANWSLAFLKGLNFRHVCSFPVKTSRLSV